MASSEESNARILAGECFCGAVSYAVADEFGYALNCHCSNCRRTTGAAFKPFAGIARDKFSVTKGEDDLMIYGDEAGHDARCSIRWCVKALSSMSPWARWSTIPRSARPLTSLSAPRHRGSRSRTICRNTGSMSCRVERLTLLREYTLAAGGLCLDGNPAEKVVGHGRTDGVVAPTKDKSMARFTSAWFVT